MWEAFDGISNDYFVNDLRQASSGRVVVPASLNRPRLAAWDEPSEVHARVSRRLVAILLRAFECCHASSWLSPTYQDVPRRLASRDKASWRISEHTIPNSRPKRASWCGLLVQLSAADAAGTGRANARTCPTLSPLPTYIPYEIPRDMDLLWKLDGLPARLGKPPDPGLHL
ncbi:hypothetical protein CCMA1212_005773 [Trichoderma ghanense]|uniref:Uncharacterized protein n=1 Tax=Trichoderma ghanense TaxID=65468 RepID=A0ABY2H214_9HYPO